MKSARYRKTEHWGTWTEGSLEERQINMLLSIGDDLPERIAVNGAYEVWIYTAKTPEGWPEMWHLSIKRRFTKLDVRDWRHLQRIKNELVGPRHEGVELFPAESRLVDTSNQYHLWILKEANRRFPFGYTQRAVVDGDGPRGSAQRPFEPGQRPPDALSAADVDALLDKAQEVSVEQGAVAITLPPTAGSAREAEGQGDTPLGLEEQADEGDSNG